MRQLVEKVELHDRLNPKIWNEDSTLREEVGEKLHEIIDQFILELDDSDIPIKVLDARLVGSNASFNYTENSDLDVHIIANFNEASCDTNVLSLLYNYFKKNFNDRYDISIHGVPVELYIEDIGSSAVSNGIYSLYREEWIKFPEPIEIPDIDIMQEYSKYENRYNDIVRSGDAEEADRLIDELYLLRKDSLSTEGEYGVGNLIFKQFRNDGYLDNLKQMLIDDTAKELSLEALDGGTEKHEKVDSVGNTLSDGQLTFFKNSKVVDNNGNLLVVFHGTKDNFTVFKYGHKNKYDSGYLGDGFYFTDNISSAKEYADWKIGYDNNAHVMSAYLNITNPLIIKSKQWATVDLQDALGIDLLSDDQKFNFKVNKDISSKLTEEVKKRGYDGIIYHNDFYDETTFVVFSPNQIKAITNKTPTFNIDINEGEDSLKESFMKNYKLGENHFWHISSSPNLSNELRIGEQGFHLAESIDTVLGRIDVMKSEVVYLYDIEPIELSTLYIGYDNGNWNAGNIALLLLAALDTNLVGDIDDICGEPFDASKIKLKDSDFDVIKKNMGTLHRLYKNTAKNSGVKEEEFVEISKLLSTMGYNSIKYPNAYEGSNETNSTILLNAPKQIRNIKMIKKINRKNEISLLEAKEDKQKLIDHVGKEDAEYFFKLKDSGRLKPPQNDLYYWLKRKPSELNSYINDVGLTITKTQQRKLDKQGADLLYDEDGWKVYKINTYDSAKYYGKGTKWCISGNYAGQEEQGQYYFNEYLSRGVNGYYFIINPFGEKWCWLDVDAEFKDAPLWDEEDNGVTNTRSVYMPNNFPEGVIDVLPNAEEFFTFPEDIIEEHIANNVLEVDDEVANILNSYDIYLQDFRFHTLYWNTDAHVKYIIGYIPQMEKLIILNGNDSDIERGTFAGDTGLRVIYLPHTIGIIFKWAFDDATNLSDIYTDMDEDEFKRKYKGNVEEDLHDINIHYDTFQEDAVHKILDEKLNESAYFSSMEGMIEQAADRNPKPEDFFEQPWDDLVDPNRFFKEITSSISKDAIQKVDKRINLNDKNNKFYRVLLKFLDAYKIPAYKRDSYTYDKLEPATMVEYSNGVRVPVDGKHTAKLCSRLGIKLPVRIMMKESLHESVNSSKIMDIVDKIIENDLRLRISNNPPKFGKPFFILPDGTFLSGFYLHTNVEEILQDISMSFYDDIDFQTPENYNYSTLLDLGCVRGRVDKVENYIQLPDDRPTSSQIDAIADAIFFAMTSGGSYIGKSGIFIEAPDTEQSRFYSFDDYEPEDIVAKIKRYYSSGILYETLEEEYLDDNEEFWDYRTKDINGKIAFDKTRSETPFGQRMIELANSGGTDSRDRKAFFYEMTPKEYFQACADGFGNSYQANMNQVNDEIIPHLKEVLTKYKKMFPVGYLEYTNGNFGQEGRHRMFAAGEIFGWDTKQPVLIIYDGDRPTIPTHKKEYDPVKSEISDDELADELDFDDLELLEDLAILEEDIEAMKPHYPNIPENRFQSIIELDPTYKIGSTNAGTYGKWLLSLANKNGGRVNDEEYITDVLKRFEENKKFLKNKDIMGFKTIYDVDDYLSDENNYKEESARQKLRRVQNFVRKTDLIKDADKVFDGNDWVIYVPKTYEASCKLGRGTTWCTATTQSDRYYNMYSGDGPLYININKHDPDEKYQFNFPTEQFMDKNDEEIYVMEFLQNNEELLDFYGDEPYIGMKLREINANNNLASFLSDKTTDEKLGETVTIDNIDDLNELIDILDEIPEESGKMSSFEILVVKNMPKIPSSAFSSRIEANMLKIENVGTIYNSAFAYCNIGTLSIYNVDKIDSASFYDSDVQEVYLEDIGTIEKKAFDGCDFITKLTFNGHISDIKENAFTNYVYGGAKVIIDGKESVKDIPNWILKDGTRVKDHDLDDIPIKAILPLLKGNI